MDVPALSGGAIWVSMLCADTGETSVIHAEPCDPLFMWLTGNVFGMMEEMTPAQPQPPVQSRENTYCTLKYRTTPVLVCSFLLPPNDHPNAISYPISKVRARHQFTLICGATSSNRLYVQFLFDALQLICCFDMVQPSH